MSINEMLEKIKPFYTLILLAAIGSIFFALGRLSTLEMAKTKVKIEYPNSAQTGTVINSTVNADKPIAKKVDNTPVIAVEPLTQSTEVIGSKSGKKYYFPWCGTVKRIKPENQVHFVSVDEAKKAGFTPGGNCKGLK